MLKCQNINRTYLLFGKNREPADRHTEINNFNGQLTPLHSMKISLKINMHTITRASAAVDRPVQRPVLEKRLLNG